MLDATSLMLVGANFEILLTLVLLETPFPALNFSLLFEVFLLFLILETNLAALLSSVPLESRCFKLRLVTLPLLGLLIYFLEFDD